MAQTIPVRSNHALLVVDVQKDFCPGGALGVNDGDTIIPVINRITPVFEHLVFSRDWHPADHCSFSEQPTFTDKSWPGHCIAGTEGAEFHDDLDVPDQAFIVSKGRHSGREEYSGFHSPSLEPWLRERNIDVLYIVGLATDYCVRFSAMDALARGFRVRIITDAVKGVDIPEGSAREALQKLADAGAELIESVDLIRVSR